MSDIREQIEVLLTEYGLWVKRYITGEISGSQLPSENRTEVLDQLLQLFELYSDKRVREAIERVLYRLPMPSTEVKEWKGHSLGLKQARYLLEDELANHPSKEADEDSFKLIPKKPTDWSDYDSVLNPEKKK